jgi:hypothetical protein
MTIRTGEQDNFAQILQGDSKSLDSVLNVVCRLGEEPEPAAGGTAWTANGASTHGRRLPYFKFSARSTGWLAWATVKTVLNSSHVLLCFAFTQTACLLKLVIPTTNAVPIGGWMLKRRRNAHCTAVADSVLMTSRKQKKILCCIVAILLSTDAAARLCARQAL